MKNIVIGGAWPYANGSLHIGHLAALLPGDVLARYWRAKGAEVFYVSGSDCHGTPITIRAKQENSTPAAISEHYHREFCEVFEKLGFSYDLYTKTSSADHISFVQDFHRQMYQSPLIEERVVKQAFCPNCQKVLTDRLIVGTCPSCGAPTRGDQCEACGSVLDADTIIDARCADCGSALSFGETKQLFLRISDLEKPLTDLLTRSYWRKNAIAFTKRYIDEGLHDRAITRDLDWGINVPAEALSSSEDYNDKKIYIWAENVLGYLSATAAVCAARDIPFDSVFGLEADARHYYIHGKDNIPFHTIILPSLLLAHGAGYHLPDDILSSEYMTLEGRKISTSQNWAVWANELASQYNPDTIRYFFMANGPEKRDTDFSWREFAEQNNSELVGAWGNFVNRTLAFIVKYRENEIPRGSLDSDVATRIAAAFEAVGLKIENGYFKDALELIFELVRFGNRYYDTQEPWKTRTADPVSCAETLYNCCYLIGNLAVLLAPFLPFSSEKVLRWLDMSADWRVQDVVAGGLPEDFGVLFTRIDIFESSARS